MPASIRPNYDVKVLLDGRDVTALVKTFSMAASIESRFDDMELTASPLLAAGLNPDILEGQPRIEVRIDGQPHWFLVEKRVQDAQQVQAWGRSAAARLDAPFVQQQAFNAVDGAAMAASDLGEEWADGLPLAWNIGDWTIPSTFSWIGTPAEGLAMLAQACGGICRATREGGLELRPKWPVAPKDLQSSPLAMAYEPDTNLLACAADREDATGVTSVEVEGRIMPINAPGLEQEEGDVSPGMDVYVRAYWQQSPDQLSLEHLTTAGQVQELGRHAETITETVTFEDGIASASKPVQSLQSVTWIGAALDAPSWEPWSTTLDAGGGFGIASITYDTVYTRFRLHGHNVSGLAYVLLLAGVGDVRVQLSLAADREPLEADEVLQEPVQTSPALALERAAMWLYEQTYDRLLIKWTALYDSRARDGMLALVHYPDAGISHAVVITSVTTSHDGLRLLQELEGVAWLV